MVWTYSDPNTSRKDEVRFMVGDTSTTAQMVQDEEIAYMLTLHPPVTGKPAWLAAAWTCDAIAGKFARQVQRSLGDLSASAQQQFEHYRDLAAHYRMLHQTNGKGTSGTIVAAPVLGGGGRTYLGGKANAYDAGRAV